MIAPSKKMTFICVCQKKWKLGWPLVLGICESFKIPRPFLPWDGNNVNNLNKWERANRDSSRARHWTRRKNVGSLGQRQSNVEAKTDMWPTNPLRKWLPVALTFCGIATIVGVNQSHNHGIKPPPLSSQPAEYCPSGWRRLEQSEIL